MENPIKMDDLGGKPTIFGNIHIYRYLSVTVVLVQRSLRKICFLARNLESRWIQKIFPLNHLAFGKCHLKTWEIYNMYWPDSVTQKKKKHLQSKNHMISGFRTVNITVIRF